MSHVLIQFFIEYLKEADRLPLCEQKKTIKTHFLLQYILKDKKIEIQIRSGARVCCYYKITFLGHQIMT